jgi:hypothetical protein
MPWRGALLLPRGQHRQGRRPLVGADEANHGHTARTMLRRACEQERVADAQCAELCSICASLLSILSEPYGGWSEPEGRPAGQARTARGGGLEWPL